MVPDELPEVPSWAAQHRKLIAYLGGFILEGVALWADAPPLVAIVAVVTGVLVWWLRNDQQPVEPAQSDPEGF